MHPVAVQIPKQLAAIFTSAAQQDYKSPVTLAALYALDSFLAAACDTGMGSGSLGSSVREQLSGVLQQLSALLSAMTAELAAETAALAAGGWDAASGKIQQFKANDALQPQFRAVVNNHSLLWVFWQDQGVSASGMWGPSGLATTVMKFATAGLQHASAIEQHVLPAVRERLPTQAAVLMLMLQESSKRAGDLYIDIASMSKVKPPSQQQGQGSEAGPWQQLLLSPHLLPCVAGALVMVNAQLGRSITTHCAQVQGSTATGSSATGAAGSSATRAAGSSAAGTSATRAAGSSAAGSSATRAAGSSSSGSGVGVNNTFTTCQLQLLQLLGLAPEVAEWGGQELDLNELHTALEGVRIACYDCFDAFEEMVLRHRRGAVVPAEQQQRWPYEQQLWQLVPAVLLPCASSLLLPGAAQQIQRYSKGEVRELLSISGSVLQLLGGQSHLDTSATSPDSPLPAALVQEYLGVLLQLTDQLLYQQAPALAQTAAAGATGSSAVPRSSTSVSGTQLDSVSLMVLCADDLLNLFRYVYVSMAEDCRVLRSRSLWQSSNHNSSNSGVDAVPPLAAMFVKGVTALEAAVRATLEAIPSGEASIGGLCVDVDSLCSALVLPLDDDDYCVMVQHMGLCGSSALAQEQRQLYSLLCALQKLSWRVLSGAEPMAAHSNLAAGSAALELLEVASSAAAAAPAATDQQSQTLAAAAVSSVSFLPSLVIVGRSLLEFAEQLQQLSPRLLAVQQSQGCSPLLLVGKQLSAASKQIPELASARLLWEQLDSWIDTVSEWLGGIDAPAHAQLAAAGCAPQQLQQQLDALLSADQGAQHSLTEDSIAALVQQLQATGAMLCKIAVPHFCNNAACAKLSGVTELQLVSGRSCICAGCHIVRYCWRECQRAAWKQHKPVCKALAATDAAAATAPTAAGT